MISPISLLVPLDCVPHDDTSRPNTFMAVIESKIQRNNKLDVKVKVYCSAPWVAEHIVYKLRATGNSVVQITFSIDAVCTDFDAADAVFYGGQVTAWLKANHLEK